MPVLNDAKTCYVGNQPITKIYAGTQIVWGSLLLRMVKFSVPGTSGSYLGAEFVEQEECADCAEMKTTYQSRFYALSGWSTWQQFSGWRTNTDGGKAFINLGQSDDTRFQDGLFELRTNGSVEQVTIDLLTAPNVGTIVPEFNCI